ncbi:MAG: DUF3786 domain-containing protein [Lachnospiraceae bacterium]|nr:DUF3786 domain-containing protein [Lachnospiraceae bacterium]
MENRAFLEMLKPAVRRLQNRSALEIAQNAGIVFDERLSRFEISSLGQEIRIEYPSCKLSEELENWHTLILLHYLDMADGTPLSREWISFGNLRDGMIRGTKFDASAEAGLQKFLAGKSEAEIKKICEKLGADFPETKADLSAGFWLFPRYPVLLNIWLEDDEFPASGKMLVNKSADHYLTVEDAVTAGEVIIAKLYEAASQI